MGNGISITDTQSAVGARADVADDGVAADDQKLSKRSNVRAHSNPTRERCPDKQVQENL